MLLYISLIGLMIMGPNEKGEYVDGQEHDADRLEYVQILHAR